MTIIGNDKAKHYTIIALLIYGVFAICAFSSYSVKFYTVEFISSLFWYHDLSYYKIYLLAPLLILIVSILQQNKFTGFTIIFVCSYLITELIVKQSIELFYEQSLEGSEVIGLIGAILFGVLLVIRAVKSLTTIRHIDVFFIAISASIISTLPHLFYLINSLPKGLGSGS